MQISWDYMEAQTEKFYVKERSVLHLEWLNPDRTFRDISVPDPTPKQDQGKNE